MIHCLFKTHKRIANAVAAGLKTLNYVVSTSVFCIISWRTPVGFFAALRNSNSHIVRTRSSISVTVTIWLPKALPLKIQSRENFGLTAADFTMLLSHILVGEDSKPQCMQSFTVKVGSTLFR